ncbi:Uncharacterized protein DAT39_019282, partial [Clarias magur]
HVSYRPVELKAIRSILLARAGCLCIVPSADAQLSILPTLQSPHSNAPRETESLRRPDDYKSHSTERARAGAGPRASHVTGSLQDGGCQGEHRAN